LVERENGRRISRDGEVVEKEGASIRLKGRCCGVECNGVTQTERTRRTSKSSNVRQLVPWLAEQLPRRNRRSGG
jgi:hypothetical protein